MLQPGTIFDSRYELVRMIGRGGFAEVWLVKDTLTGLEEALKIYAPGSGMDEDGLKIFAKELSVVHDLRHTNLLTPKSLGQYENQPYLILPYCPNGSLNKLVGLCPEDEAWRILEQVAAGLAYLHEQGIVHQDIKPDNILIDAKQYYVITDFGISLRAQSTLRKSVRDQANSGTMAYMAPERFSAEPHPIPANDIWSLGAMMFELIEGDVPFVEQMGGLAQKGGADIPTMHANVSDNLKRVIQSMLALNAADRPTASQLVELAKSKSAPSVSAQPEVVPAFTAEDKKTQIVDKNTLPKQDESQHEQEPKTKDAAPQQTPPQVEAPAPEAPKKSSSSRKRLGILGVIFVMIGIGVGAFFLGQQTKPVPVDYVATDYVVADTTSDDYIVPDTVAEADAIETEQRQREEAEAYRKAKEIAELKAQEEAAKNAIEEAEMKAKAEAEQKAKEEVRKAEEVARKAEAARIEEARRAEEARKAEERKTELKSQGWVDLGLPSGTLWKNENEPGGFYTYDEAVAKFGSSLPTKEQFEELKNKCKWTWTGNGYRVNGPSGESIVLPAAGHRLCSGSVSHPGSSGYYWSSTPNGSEHAWRLYFCSIEVRMYDVSRCQGLSVRLVR